MFVTVAIDQQWLVHVAPLPGQNGIHDDFMVGDDQAMAKLAAEWDVAWLPDREDDRLEIEAFDLRRRVRRFESCRGHFAKGLVGAGICRSAGLLRAPLSAVSGGQRQRALVAQADVLLLDEPTAGVDAATQAVVLEALAQEAARGAVAVHATHEPTAVEAADRVLALVAGRVDATVSTP